MLVTLRGVKYTSGDLVPTGISFVSIKASIIQ